MDPNFLAIFLLAPPDKYGVYLDDNLVTLRDAGYVTLIRTAVTIALFMLDDILISSSSSSMRPLNPNNIRAVTQVNPSTCC